ncbi:MAG: selenium cofactor biosynthesis protein YqeC [Eubacteriales bacterium]|nr:selenium cofactor biosynthesis protein YqeC [Eubacteriales bacterium]
MTEPIFYDALALPDEPGLTCLVGGGGKTSLMYRLGAELAASCRSAVVTTTTRIGVPLPGQARFLDVRDFEDPEMHIRPGEVVCICRRDAGTKLSSPGCAILPRLIASADRVISEADGARRLPVKAPNSHEPCIPPAADTVVAVAGLTALGKPLHTICFRCDLVCALLGAEPGDLLTPALLARLLTHPLGQFKEVGSVSRFRLLLNQADNDRLLKLGLETAAIARTCLPGLRVVIGTLEPVPSVRGIVADTTV